MSIASTVCRAEHRCYSHSQLAHLQQAMDMRYLVDLLRQDWDYLKRHDLQLLGGRLERIYSSGSQGFLLDYALHLRRGDQFWKQPLKAELVAGDSHAYFTTVLGKLKKSYRAQLAATDSDRLACFPQLGLVLRFPGLDHRLLGMKLIHQPALLAETIGQLHGSAEQPLAIKADILAHRLGRRCVARIRYRIPGASEASSLIIKLFKERSARDEQVIKTMRTLWESGFDADSLARIPRPLAHLPDYQAVLMEDVQGVELTELPQPHLPEALCATGGVLRKLHQLPLLSAVQHQVDDEIALLARWRELTCASFPSLADGVQRACDRVWQELEQCRGNETTLVHRDFYEQQIMLSGRQLVLLDFDTLAEADPALDIGNMQAHLFLASFKQAWDWRLLQPRFLEGYGAQQAANLSLRSAAYTRAALLRLACLHAFWPRWQHLSQPLLEAIDEV